MYYELNLSYLCLAKNSELWEKEKYYLEYWQVW
jgi:hypothetical protein